MEFSSRFPVIVLTRPAVENKTAVKCCKLPKKHTATSTPGLQQPAESVPIPAPPLEDFDFSVIDSKTFKEDSVREEIILPILKVLGYAASGENRILRSKALEHPFLTVGSKNKPITLIPDYLLTVGGNFTFVLDAKAPGEEIKSGRNFEQVYSYAVHPEIRVELFALCNGASLSCLRYTRRSPFSTFTSAN